MSVSQATVAEANRRYHDRIVDRYESITHAGFLHYDNHVERRLEQMVRGLGDARGRRALDVGAGTGFFTKHLLSAGFAIDAVEISPGMADELRRRYGGTGRLNVIETDVLSYLDSADARYAVISFVSVLHHLYDYADVLARAAAHVEPGGYLYTTCDPVRSDRPGASKWLHAVDRTAYNMVRPSVIARRMARFFRSVDPSSEDFALAEYHAREGLCVMQVASAVEAGGLDPVSVRKNPTCKLGSFRFMERILKSGTDLETIWRRPTA